MSAFIVSKIHIDSIITIASLQTCNSVKEIINKYKNFDLIGQILWNENHKSVNYRYNENHPTPTYSFRYKFVDLGQALKAIDCLDYQSCEHPDYQESEAKKILDILEQALLSKMKNSHPQYEKAAWSIEE
jgi:hypothetical protein